MSRRRKLSRVASRPEAVRLMGNGDFSIADHQKGRNAMNRIIVAAMLLLLASPYSVRTVSLNSLEGRVSRRTR